MDIVMPILADMRHDRCAGLISHLHTKSVGEMASIMNSRFNTGMVGKEIGWEILEFWRFAVQFCIAGGIDVAEEVFLNVRPRSVITNAP